MELGLSPRQALLLLLTLWPFGTLNADTFRVVTYNVESYLTEPVRSRPAKTAEAKAKVHESILALRPDVLALQEIGSTNALLELQASLKAKGLNLPHWELTSGYDTNIHVAVLSRYPFTARPHTNESFLLNGRRLRVSRGFAEVDIQVSTNYSFTLLAGHLKSRRPAFEDEAELRLQEAKRLRELIDARLDADQQTNFIVLGDFNDTQDSPPIKTLVGRGKTKLVDARPTERNGDADIAPAPGRAPRNIAWTHYYATEDSYSRIDYLLLSPGLAREWVPEETYVLAIPNWGIASDHRPIVATFEAEER
jgi:endonuclease/exonuclease/phosphatase family metal-dependent hydrolase